jgi:Molybdenum cofactor biosynthesis protein F.
MNVPMHRFKYTQLTGEQIGRKLGAVQTGPACASEYSDALAGKSLKIVTDNGGPVLQYTFANARRLRLEVDSGSQVECGYGALTLKRMVFVSHLVPGTQKGYNVVIDTRTGLVTVFEIWFSGGKDSAGVPLDPREVQRQIYYGYLEEAGKPAPKKRHHLTNRVEGKGFFWKQDTGIETLELYPSIVSSSFVELTRHADDLLYCSTSDFVMVDDNTFVYDRTECEFSGIHTMYVFDLYVMKQIGVRVGFNEKDELEYYIFRGDGEMRGQLAILEPFSYQGEKIDFGSLRKQSNAKGERAVYRPLRTMPRLTEEQVYEVGRKNTVLFGGGDNVPQQMADNRLPYTGFLAGKELTVRYDNGVAWNYRFSSPEKLSWRRDGESQWHEEEYRAFESDESLIFFSHMHSGTRPAECVQIALDFANGLSTCVNSKMGSEYFAVEVSYKIVFGVMEMKGLEAPHYMRHTFTDEMVGRAFSWNYSESMTSMHMYATPHSASWTIFLDNGALGMNWSAPCQYVKLRDDIYLFTLVEEACNGAQMCVVINTRIMHDGGFGMHCTEDRLNLGVASALARNIGQFDIMKYMGPRNAPAERSRA